MGETGVGTDAGCVSCFGLCACAAASGDALLDKGNQEQ